MSPDNRGSTVLQLHVVHKVKQSLEETCMLHTQEGMHISHLNFNFVMLVSLLGPDNVDKMMLFAGNYMNV